MDNKNRNLPPKKHQKPRFLLKVDEEEIKALRERMLETRRVVHKVTEEEVSKRWSYEEGVSLVVAYVYYLCFVKF